MWHRHAFAQTFPANVSYNEYQYAIVQARAAGFIDKAYPLTVGDKVQKGTPLLTSPFLLGGSAAASIHCCEMGEWRPRRRHLERLRLAGMPQVDTARSPRNRYLLTLKAPIDGVITAFDLRAQVNIAKDNVVAKIQGMDPVWVTADPQSLSPGW
ncbi:efflux RND transporter periplasmic adaptor subunit [Escherichia coli]